MIQALAARYGLPLAANASAPGGAGAQPVTADARSWTKRPSFDPEVARNM